MRIFKMFFAVLALMFIFQLNAFAQDSHNLIQSVQYDEQNQTIKVFSSALMLDLNTLLESLNRSFS